MAGLPVLLRGGAEAVTAATAMPADDDAALGSAVVAGLSITSAFRLRGRHAGWVPLLVLIVVISLALRIWTSIAAWTATGRTTASPPNC